jgi:L-ascorbate metabolism protein UlaG (beta-lactamase superfamily)
MLIFFGIVVALVLSVVLFLQHPKFGAKAKGARLQRMHASPNYKNGAFVNRTFTLTLTEGFSMRKVMLEFFFNKSPHTKPQGIIPSIKTNLKDLPAGDWLVWFGHSSYFIRTDGLNILVDPVFSGNASPIPGTTKAFKGSDIYGVDDMPQFDYLFITHDHYDHLDYETIKALKSKVKQVITGLGVGAHLERWGYQPEMITEMDWDDEVMLKEGITVYGFTGRHFSGRSFKRNATLWISFLLQTPTHKIYFGGDSGYDQHFKEIGERHGPIDLAILENGQYNEAWKAIHFLPGENLQAAAELKAKRLMPVHSGKFDLSLHHWDDPLKEMVNHNQKTGIPLVTPKIGDLVDLNNNDQAFTEWWKEVDSQI